MTKCRSNCRFSNPSLSFHYVNTFGKHLNYSTKCVIDFLHVHQFKKSSVFTGRYCHSRTNHMESSKLVLLNSTVWLLWPTDHDNSTNRGRKQNLPLPLAQHHSHLLAQYNPLPTYMRDWLESGVLWNMMKTLTLVIQDVDAESCALVKTMSCVGANRLFWPMREDIVCLGLSLSLIQWQNGIWCLRGNMLFC
jgi:hypothetical protein